MILIPLVSSQPLARIRRIYKDHSLKGMMSKRKSKKIVDRKGAKEKGLGDSIDVYV